MEAKTDAEVLVYVIGELKKSVGGDRTARFKAQDIGRVTRAAGEFALKLSVSSCGEQLGDVSRDISKRRATLAARKSLQWRLASDVERESFI